MPSSAQAAALAENPTAATSGHFATPVRSDAGVGISRLAAEIAAAGEGNPGLMAGRVIEALKVAAADPLLLTAEACVGRPETYARHVLHADPQGRFTILALVWSEGQFSPAHAHHTWCAYAVREGRLSETLFRFDTALGQAIPLRSETRRAGYGCFARSGLDHIHRLGNATSEPAVSIHVYGVGAAQICSKVNRVLDARS